MSIRFILHLLLCVFSYTSLSASTYEDAESMLKQLDRIINNRKEYDAQKEQKLNRLKESIPLAGNDSVLYQIYDRLFKQYYNYQTDSAMNYVNLKRKLSGRLTWDCMNDVRMDQAQLFSTMGMYKESIEALEAVERDKLTSEQVERYLQLYSAIYYLISEYSLTTEEQNKYARTASAYSDTLLAIYPKDSPIYQRALAGRFTAQKKYTEAIAILENIPASYQTGHLKGLVAFDLASAYEGMGNKEREVFYLAKSAIVDLELSIKEYISLHKLAFLLYNMGDIERAYKYLNCSMDDAVFCNARFRTISITQTYPIIDKAYRLKAQSEEALRQVLFVSITILLFFLLAAIVYVYRQMQKLRTARQELSLINAKLQDLNRQLSQVNRELSRVNQELSSANSIKQEYIVHYLDQCTMYLDKMENYRRTLENLAITSNLKELFKAIKSEAFIGEEREKFYKSFDETFLSMFPHFVESFNALLREEERLEPKPGELLSTELRIFALIRLGITDSTKIARFLRYSLATIYSYRSKVRNKAIDKINFEQLVEQIQS